MADRIRPKVCSQGEERASAKRVQASIGTVSVPTQERQIRSYVALGHIS
jgi:hypothetical protein